MRIIISFALLSLFLSPQLRAQETEHDIFKVIIQELYEEAKTKKAAHIAAYQKSSEEVKPYENRKPLVSVFGAPQKEAEEIVKIIEEAFEENSTEKSGEQKNAAQKKSDRKINFKQIHMEDGKGEALTPAHAQKPRETEWISSETISFSYEEIIDESNYTTEQRQEYEIIGNHNSNTLELNRIGFIEAIYTETQTPSGYAKFKDELHTAGHDIQAIMRRSFFLEKTEQLDYLRSKLNQIIDAVIY